MPVEVKPYRMSAAVPPAVIQGAVELITEAFTKAGETAGLYLTTTSQQRPTPCEPDAPQFKFVKFEHGQMTVIVRTAGKNMAMLWRITPPDAEAGQRLSQKLGGGEDDELIAAAVPRRTADAPAAASPATADPNSIAARYQAAEQEAAPYAAKMQRLAALNTQLQTLYAQVEQVEQQVKAAEADLARNAAGKEAYERLCRIRELLGVPHEQPVL